MTSTKLNKSQRRRKLGIECPDRLVWKNWEPGEEHVRKLIIKNVDSRVQVITFTLPENRTTFLTPFPEPITLSSGVSYELTVRFCPSELLEVHDSIDIQVKGRGAFTVALDCLTPFARMTCTPATHDFGFCPVGSTTTNTDTPIKMTNTGTVPLDYYWEVGAPFAITPSQGHLEPGEAHALRVSFCPTEACAVVCQAVCRMTELEEEIGTLQLSGVGKYPFVRLRATDADGSVTTLGQAALPVATASAATKKDASKTAKKRRGHASAAAAATSSASFNAPVFTATVEMESATVALVDFRNIPAGCTASREIAVENPSLVPAHVVLHCSDEAGSDADGASMNARTAWPSPFRIQPAAATIPPGGRQTYKVSFKATSTGSKNHFLCELRSSAGNAIQLALKASVTGPRVKLSTSYLDYGDVDLDRVLPSERNSAEAATRAAQQCLVKHVTLTNTSTARPCAFQFLSTAPGAAFHVEPCMGVVAPGQSVRVRVTFQPTAPVHYLRRLFLLTESSAEMLFVDAFGTAYRGDTRPPPLGLREVDAFFDRLSNGLAHCTPAEIQEMAFMEGDVMGTTGLTLPDVLTWSGGDTGEADGVIAIPTTRKGTGRLPFAVAADQLAVPLPSRSCPNTGPFALDSKVLTFSRGGAGGGPDGDSSNSGGITSAQYVAVYNASPEPAVATWAVPYASAFTVFPQQLEVPAGGSAQFQVMYRSSAADAEASGATAVASSLTAAHMQFLECYVNYAQMSSFRLIRSRAAVTPPHCLVLQCRRDGAASTVPASSHTQVSGRRPLGGGGGGGGGGVRGAAVAADMGVSAADAHVAFPVCRVGATTYQVVSLVNDSDVAHMFELKGFTIAEVSEKIHKGVVQVGEDGSGPVASTAIAAEGSPLVGTGAAPAAEESAAATRGGVDVGATFTCFPHTGLLPPRQRALLLLRFHPTCDARYDAAMHLQVYTSGGKYHEGVTVMLRGETDIPRLTLVTTAEGLPRALTEDDADNRGTTVVFPPSCVTGEVRRPLWLCNPTSLAVDYELVPSKELLGVLRFEPAAGVLSAGARQSVVACFAPESARRYEGSAFLLTNDATVATSRNTGADVSSASTGTKEYATTWPVIGEGVHAVIEVEPTEMDLGTVAGLTPQTVALTLYNSGLCEVGYEVRSFTCSEPAAWRHATEPPTLRNHRGTIPARTHRVVRVTVHPAAAGTAEYLLYAMVAGLGTDITRVASPTNLAEAERHPHCRLTIQGTRPAVQVADVRSLTQLRSHLWRQLSIPALNRQLAAPVQPADVARDMYAFHQFVEGLSPVTMELAVGPQHGVPATFTVRLENVGDTAADFSLWLPTESSVTEENWFLEDGALKDIQRILDRRVMEITPRHGTIAAGGSTTLTIVYRFVEIGIHTLPVALRVADGRRALVVLEGRTVPEGVGCLATHAPSAEYTLLPVALGDVEPPMQSVMVLDNPLDCAVTYMVDQQALRELAEQNYGFPVLQCVNPTGVLPPRSMTELHWYFRPLEAKEYVMSVPILTRTGSAAGDEGAEARRGGEEEDGESYTYTFVGRGYHPSKTSAEAVRTMTEEAFLPVPLSIPSSQQLSLVPTLPVTLGPEALAIGAVPYFTLHRACCTLVNTHPTDTYTFEFDTRHTYGDHMLTIQPARGRLAPNGGRVECRVAFYTGSTSQLLQWSVPCHLMNETVVERAMAADGFGKTVSTTHEALNRPDEEYFAVDGKGLQQKEVDARASQAATTGRTVPATTEFQRTTCTKKDLMRLRRLQQQQAGSTRLPVTTIPAESLGIAALSRRVVAGREEAGAATLSLATATTEPVVSATLELLVQARVMPTEEYERIYGRESLHRTYQPLVAMYADPMDPATCAGMGPIAVDDAAVASEVMNEMVRAVVAQPAVQEAFREPHPCDVVYYRDIKNAATRPADTTDQASHAANQVLTGLVGNVMEEALEELVFQAVMSGVSATCDAVQ